MTQKKRKTSTKQKEPQEECNEETTISSSSSSSSSSDSNSRVRRRYTWEGAAAFARVRSTTSKMSPDVASLPFRASILDDDRENQQKNKKKRTHQLQNKIKTTKKKAPQSLQLICLEFICKNIESVESFGVSLPPNLQGIATEILARERKLNRTTLSLFLEDDLTALHLSGCSELDHESLAMIAATSPKLKRITLKACGRLSDELLIDLVQRCKELEEVELDGVYGITDASLGLILQLHKLKKLCLGWATQCFSHQFGTSWISSTISLTSLQLVSCHLFNDKAAECMSKTTTALKCLLVEDAPLLGDIGLLHLLRASSSAVTSLTLDKCPRVTDSGLLDALGVVDFNGQLSLQNLHLVALPMISDLSVVEISKHTPQLKSLTLSGCQLITNEAIKAVFQQCSQLQRLDINAIPSIQGKRVVNYIRSLKMLQYLDISWCKDLDDTMIDSLLHHNKSLQLIVMWGTTSVTDIAIQKLQQAGVEILGK